MNIIRYQRTQLTTLWFGCWRDWSVDTDRLGNLQEWGWIWSLLDWGWSLDIQELVYQKLKGYKSRLKRIQNSRDKSSSFFQAERRTFNFSKLCGRLTSKKSFKNFQKFKKCSSVFFKNQEWVSKSRVWRCCLLYSARRDQFSRLLVFWRFLAIFVDLVQSMA